jgi:hypothetical protein
VAYRQLLVQGVLAVLLPTEDLENECLTSLVGQIFSELVIGDIVANRVAEPWFIWECLTILSGTIRRKRAGSADIDSSEPEFMPLKAQKESSLRRLFWSVVQWCLLAASFIRSLVISTITSRSLPSRAGIRQRRDITGRKRGLKPTDPGSLLEADSELVKVPVLTFKIWPALSNLVQLDIRMPWLLGLLSMIQWMAVAGPGRVGGVGGILDR